MTDKEQLRKDLARKRRTLSPVWIEQRSDLVIRRLLCLHAYQTARTVALYMALPGEVLLDTLFATCRDQGRQTCIPVFNRQTRLYELAKVDETTTFKVGNHGIWEPVEVPRIPIEEVDLMLVPGVAFDLQGNRLGRGGGYYDRLLDGFTGCSAAVSFDFQVYSHIPHESHDRPVDVIITPTKTHKV